MKYQIQSGLGDAVYSYPVIKELRKTGPLSLWTPYPEVFHDLNIEFSKEKIGRKLAYQRQVPVNFYEQICKSAGITPPPFEWPTPAQNISKGWKKLCLVKLPSTAHMHREKRNFMFAPSVNKMQEWISAHYSEYIFIAVKWDDVYIGSLDGISVIYDKLTITEYLELCGNADCILTQVGHLCPIAQALGKDLVLFMPEKPIPYITPEKILVNGARGTVKVIE